MDLSNMAPDELDEMLDSLARLEKMKDDNLLEFTDWEFYEKQNGIRSDFLLCFRVGNGPRIFIIFGGNRSGKSVTGASIVAEIFSKYHSKKIWCATESDLSIKVQQAKLEEYIPKDCIFNSDFNVSRGWKNNLILSKTHSKIWFKTYQQERKAYQGESLDLIWFDEECPWDIFQESLARVMDRNGMILFTFTSLMGFTRLVNFLYSDNMNIQSYTLTMLDNPYVEEKAKQNYLNTCDKDEIASRVYGQPKLKAGLVYKEFKDEHIIDDFDYIELVKGNPSRYKIYEGLDPHIKTPHRWLRFCWDTAQKILYIVDEIVAPQESMLVSEFAKIIKAKRDGIKPSYCQIDTSSSAPILMRGFDEPVDDHHTVRSEFHKAGIQTMVCIKDNAVGIRSVKNRLRSYKTETQEVKPTLYVFSSCSSTIYEFRRYSWASHVSAKISERKEELNEVNKKDDHMMDILKYQCIRLDQGSSEDINVTGPQIRN